MNTFCPTHLIRFTPTSGQSTETLVQLCEDAGEGTGGPAYTREEWESGSMADWERHEDGSWTCLGQATPGGASGTLTIEQLAPPSAAQLEAGYALQEERLVAENRASEEALEAEAKLLAQLAVHDRLSAGPEGILPRRTREEALAAAREWFRPIASLEEVRPSGRVDAPGPWDTFHRLEDELRTLVRDAQERWQDKEPVMAPPAERSWHISSAGGPWSGAHQIHFGQGVDAMVGDYGIQDRWATQEDFDRIVALGLRAREEHDRALKTLEALKSTPASESGRVDCRFALALALLALAALWLVGGSCSGWLELGGLRLFEVAP